MQQNIEKDLGITSPFRTSPLRNRSNQFIKHVDVDGVQGSMSSDSDEDFDLGENSFKITPMKQKQKK
jgi:hypothetical protein